MIEFYMQGGTYRFPRTRALDKHYKSLADFLTADATGFLVATQYMTAVEAVQAGEQDLLEQDGDMYIVTITPEQVTLDLWVFAEHGGPQDLTVYPLSEFATILRPWRDFLLENNIIF